MIPIPYRITEKGQVKIRARDLLRLESVRKTLQAVKALRQKEKALQPEGQRA